MAKALVGRVSPEGKRLIQLYLDYFVPDAEIVDLKSVGIRSRVKSLGRRSDTILVILDEFLYSQCVGVADEVLACTKTHKYIDDTGLKQFLISKFGELPYFEENKEVLTTTNIDDTALEQFLISMFDKLPYFEENKVELMSSSESFLCAKEIREAITYDSFQVVIDFNKEKIAELESELKDIKTQIKMYENVVDLLKTQQSNFNKF